VPTPPEFSNALGDIGIIEIFRKPEPHHFSKADSNIRIAGKIEI